MIKKECRTAFFSDTDEHSYAISKDLPVETPLAAVIQKTCFNRIEEQKRDGDSARPIFAFDPQGHFLGLSVTGSVRQTGKEILYQKTGSTAAASGSRPDLTGVDVRLPFSQIHSK
jgi:hypothetical protein